MGARYPITELELGPSNYVASDYCIDGDNFLERDERTFSGHCLIMTGPNMGGNKGKSYLLFSNLLNKLILHQQENRRF